ncbi:MAG: hypothetical protein WAO61_07335 [Solirubrobacterales bacterium]
MSRSPIRRTLRAAALTTIVLSALGASGPPELGPLPRPGDIFTAETAIDVNHVYWLRVTITGISREHGLEAREDVVQRTLATGAERVIFSTIESDVYNLYAGGGRVTFTTRIASTNRRRKTNTRFDRVFAMDAADPAPRRIAKLGGTVSYIRPTRPPAGDDPASPAVCDGFGYGKNVAEDGTIVVLERREFCNRGLADRAEYAGYRRDGTRVVLAGRLDADRLTLFGNRLFSAGEGDLAVTDIATAVTTPSPVRDWIEYLDFEGDRAVGVRSDDDYEYRSAYIWFEPGTLNPVKRVTIGRGRLAQVRLCDSGYVVITGRVRNWGTGRTFRQLLGDPPYVATFFTDGDQPLRSVRLPSRGIDELDCAGDNLIAMMDGRTRPLVKIIPFG